VNGITHSNHTERSGQEVDINIYGTSKAALDIRGSRKTATVTISFIAVGGAGRGGEGRAGVALYAGNCCRPVSVLIDRLVYQSHNSNGGSITGDPPPQTSGISAPWLAAVFTDTVGFHGHCNQDF